MRFVRFLFVACCIADAQSGEYEQARQLLASGRASEAAGVYREMLRSQPKNADLHLNLSIAEYKAGNFREATASAVEALRLAPDLLPANLFLGASYLELGQFREASEPLERVIAADPRERNGRLMLGEALAGTGAHEAAAEQFRVAAEMLPADPRVWYGLAKSYEAIGQKVAATDAWQRLMALPSSVQSHMHMAERNAASLRWRDAAVEWSEALKLAPQNRRARYGLAWAQFRSRDYDSAMATLKPLLEGNTTTEALFLYGASLVNMQQPSEAIPVLRAALEKDSGSLPTRAALGQALLQTGKPEEAIPLLQAATSIDEDGSIHFQLFRAYQLTQRTEKAREVFTAYQRLKASAKPVH